MDVYLIIVVVLMITAIIDLTVGVANDAVNFLNSAIGSKAAKFRTILIIAGIGVLIGVMFSSGMMEIARKGIFNPEYFVMPELLFIFLAVMFQDILLLDFFNTFGLPTSTTVSIVFGLFGASIAISLIKIALAGDSLITLSNYINWRSVGTIVSAIVLSIVIAFVVGAIIQYITRLIFTFDYQKRFKKYGAIWSGFALTALTLFIILKGAKGAAFISEDTSIWIKSNIPLLSIYLVIGWTIILQILMWTTKINVLKIIVLFGTFALAMAFAANDLVNFIGAPLAGLNAYKIAMGAADPATTSMEVLRNPLQAEIWILLVAGIIMMLTLFLSKKAQTVAKTTIRLGRQSDGVEKFKSNSIARFLVRIVILIFHYTNKMLPQSVIQWSNKRFDVTKYKPMVDEKGEAPAFDTLRASVILMVAAALISFATSLKLPLSTTYVTFIVAMAAALPDKAWGRESAVYRVSGVVTVVGGWFFTALAASIVAGVIALLLYYFEIWAVLVFLGLVGYSIYRTTIFNIQATKKEEKLLEKFRLNQQKTTDDLILDELNDISKFIKSIAESTINSNYSLAQFNLSNANQAHKQSKENAFQSELIRNDILKLLPKLPNEEIDENSSYTKALSSFQEVSARALNLTSENLRYVANNHNELTKDQIAELTKLNLIINSFSEEAILRIKERNNEDLSSLTKIKDEAIKEITQFSKNQLKRYKESSINLRRSMLYINIMTEIEVIIYNIITVVQVAKDISEQAAQQRYNDIN